VISKNVFFAFINSQQLKGLITNEHKKLKCLW